MHYIKKTYLFILTAMVVAFVSCEEAVVLDVPFESRLVVNSFFTASSPWSIEVSRSNNILDGGTAIELVEDARVIVYDQDGAELYELDYLGNGLYGKEDFGPSSTRGYSVQVTSGSKVVTAYSYAPAISKLTINSYEPVVEGKESGVAVDFQIEDRSKIDAFYIWEIVDLDPNSDADNKADTCHLSDVFFDDLGGKSRIDTEDGREIVDSKGFGDGTFSTIYSTIGRGRGGFAGRVVSSGVMSNSQLQLLGDNTVSALEVKDKIGAEHVGNLLGVFDGRDEGSDEEEDEIVQYNYELRVMTISSQLYDYYRSVERSRSSANTSANSHYPLYSNVEGGLGIFAGYSESMIRF